MKIRMGESGNIFFTLFGAVALVGVVGAATSTLMRGPVGTVVALNQRAKADSQMQIAMKLAMLEAQNTSNDCDNDTLIEPVGAGTAIAGLNGGGRLPSVGSTTNDPWGTPYGYCGWDHGTTTGSNCSGGGALLTGNATGQGTVIAVLSAGPDRQFGLTCVNGPAANAPYITRGTNGADDLIISMTYAEANEASGGLWSIMSSDPDKITTNRALDVSTGAQFSGDNVSFSNPLTTFGSGSKLDLSAGSLFMLPDETQMNNASCTGVNKGTLRRFTDDAGPANGSLEVLQICDGSAWQDIGGAGGAVAAVGNDGDIQFSMGGVMSADSNLRFASSGLSVGGTGTFTGNLSTGGTLSASGALNVSGNSTLTGTLDVDGAVDFDSTVNVALGATFGSWLRGADGTSGAPTYSFTSDNDSGMFFSSNALRFSVDGTERMAVASGGVTMTAGQVLGNLTVGGTLTTTDLAVTNNITANRFISRMASTSAAAPGFETEPGTGMYSAVDNTLSLVAGGTPRLVIDGAGDVGIGVLSPNAKLDVGGELKLGTSNAVCDTPLYGAIRYVSGDLLQVCSSFTNSWEDIGTSGGGGGGAASYWTRISVADPRLYYDTDFVGVGTNNPLDDFHVNGDLLVTGSHSGTASAAISGAGARLFFDPDSSAFRVGGVTASQWNQGNLGNYSMAMGFDVMASGAGAAAFGQKVSATGVNAFAYGLGTAAGAAPVVSGASSYGIFMGDRSGVNLSESNVWALLGGKMLLDQTPGTAPGVSGLLTLDVNGDVGAKNYCDEEGINCFSAAAVANGSVTAPGNNRELIYNSGGVLGANPNMVFSAAGNLLLGGTGAMGLPSGDSTNRPAATVTVNGMLRYNTALGRFEGYQANSWKDIVTSAIVGGAATPNRGIQFSSNGNFAATNQFQYTSGGSLVISGTNTGVSDTSLPSGAGSRMFFDPANGAFRAGTVSGTQWDAANLGTYSIAMGQNPIAGGQGAVALGYNVTANGYGSVSMGGSNTASGSHAIAMGFASQATGNDSSIALGYGASASGASSMALGYSAMTSAPYSMALGLGNFSSNQPRIAAGATNSMAIFMGAAQDNSVSLSTPNTMALFGGKFLLDPRAPASQLAPRADIDFGASSNAILLPIGQVANRPSAPVNGMLRYNSTTDKFEGYQGGVWQDILTSAVAGGAAAPNRGIQFNSNGNFAAVSNLQFTSGGSFLTSGTYSGAGDTSLPTGAGARFFFDPTKAAFRAGHVNGTQWDNPSVGAYSTALGLSTTASNLGAVAMGLETTASEEASTALGFATIASGPVSTAMGADTRATGEYATAMGVLTIAQGRASIAMGQGAAARGINSAAIGFGSATGLVPSVNASRAYGLFFGDQSGVTMPVVAQNTMGIFGGKLVIDPRVPASQTSARTTLDIGAATDAIIMPIGATAQRPGSAVNGMIRYNNETNKFEGYQGGGWQDILTSAVAGGAAAPNRGIQFNSGGSFAADSKLQFTSGGSLLTTGTYSGVGDTSLPTGVGTRMFFDPTKAAFRAGAVLGTQWDTANIGKYSVGMGYSTTASGDYSSSFGIFSQATSYASFAAGENAFATGYGSLALGHFISSAGSYGMVLGRNAATDSASSSSMALGLIATASVPTPPKVQGNESLGIFMGKQDAIVMTANRTMGLFGGAMVIDPRIPAQQLAARSVLDLGAATDSVVMPSGTTAQRPASPVNGMIRYNSQSNKFEGYQAGSWQDILTSAVAGGAAAPNRGIQFNSGGSFAADSKLQFTSGGSLLTTGTYSGAGDTSLPTGAGTRLFFDPTKAAFRAGSVNGTQWDNASVGTYSTALGYNTTASGQYSTAIGSGATASGQNSVAMGLFSSASDLGSTAIGLNVTASGKNSTALGTNTTASGIYSTAIGYGTTASGTASTAMGNTTSAGGAYSTAMGRGTTASGANSFAMGEDVAATAANSVAIGLGSPTGTMPSVNAKSAYGLFFDDQSGVVMADPAARNTMGIFGGKLLVDPRVPALQTSARADIDFGASTNAVLLPTGDGTNRPAAAVNGMIRYNNSSNKFEGYQNGSWQDIVTGAAGGSAANPDRGIQFNSGGNFAASSGLTFSASNVLDITSDNYLPFNINNTTEGWMSMRAMSASGRVGMLFQPANNNHGFQITANGSEHSLVLGDNGNNVNTFNTIVKFNGNGVVEFSSTGAMALNRGTTVQRPSAAVDGMIRYNTTTSKFEGYQGGTWQDIVTGAATSTFLSLTDTPVSYAAQANKYVRVNSGATALEFTDEIIPPVSGQPAPSGMILDDLADVAISTPTAGQTLFYSGGQWINGTGESPAAAGSSTHIQFNSGGSFAASSNLTYSATSGLQIGFGPAPTYLDAAITAYSSTSGKSFRWGPTHANSATIAGYLGHDGGTNTIDMDINNAHFEISLGEYINSARKFMIYKGFNTATIDSVMQVYRYNNNGAGANGIGAAYDTYLESTIGSYLQGSRLQTVATNAVAANFTTRMDLIPYYNNAATIGLNILGTANGVQVGINNIAPIVGLDINTNDAAILPRGTTAQRPSTSVNGMIRYNSESNKFEGYQAGVWQDLITGGGVAASPDRSIQFNSGGAFSASGNFVYNADGSVYLQNNGTFGGYSSAVNGSWVGKHLSLENSDGTAGSFTGLSLRTASFDSSIASVYAGTADRGRLAFGVEGLEALSIYQDGSVTFNSSGAFTMNTGTTAQRPSAAQNGMIRYNTTTAKFEGYQGGTWQDIVTGAATSTFLSLIDTPVSYAAQANKYVRVNSGATALEFTDEIIPSVSGIPAPSGIILDDLADVVISTPTAGQTLLYSGGQWVNGSGGGSIDSLSDGATNYTLGNLFLGQGAGANAGASTNFNVALGMDALNLLSQGDGNTAVGNNALKNLGGWTARYSNTALGASAGESLSAGVDNVMVGTSAMGGMTNGSMNVAIGSSAMNKISGVGASNVAIGYEAMKAFNDGVGNIAIGKRAADNLTDGSSNITIGTDVDVLSPVGSNQLNIGNTLYGDMSNDRIGIGKAPDTGIELDVLGDVQYTGTLTDVSDMRLKEHILPLNGRGSMLDKLGQVGTYSFTMKGDESGQVEFGVMAQEINKVFPELVKVDEATAEKYMSVNYVGMIAPLIEASKELKAENDLLKAQISTIEARMASLEGDMDGMKAHTGYGINKAQMGLGMLVGMMMMGGMAGVAMIVVNRRRRQG